MQTIPVNVPQIEGVTVTPSDNDCGEDEQSVIYIDHLDEPSVRELPPLTTNNTASPPNSKGLTWR